MTMDNLHLFQLINAGPGLGLAMRWSATALAEWAIYLVPLALAIAWIRGHQATRCELLQMLLTSLIALAFAQVVAHVWPMPRPFAMHLGTQYLAHSNDPGMPSDHVTVFWSLALAALATERFGAWGFPLLAMGLVVGWARVYLGVHFPFDILAAFPVALAAALLAGVVRWPLLPLFSRFLDTYDRIAARFVGFAVKS